jgi:hypothetical protein
MKLIDQSSSAGTSRCRSEGQVLGLSGSVWRRLPGQMLLQIALQGISQLTSVRRMNVELLF